MSSRSVLIFVDETLEVAAAFNTLSGSKYMELIDRIAILASKMLNKLQAERMDGSKK